MMTSGSCRKMALRALAKVRSILALTWVWPTPESSYSMGSSTVKMFLVLASSCCKPAYKVVVLPLPVGPVTKTMPWGCSINLDSRVKFSPVMPTELKLNRVSLLSSSLSTARSPCAPGNVETRTSMAFCPSRKEIRPSWGKRFSAMSKSAMIFSLEIRAACSARCV